MHESIDRRRPAWNGKRRSEGPCGIHGEKNEIIIACRSEKLRLETLEELRKNNGNATFSMIIRDLSDMRSIKSAVSEI